eukprot:1157822-Pelagomonas_calceolata.AAC.18
MTVLAGFVYSMFGRCARAIEVQVDPGALANLQDLGFYSETHVCVFCSALGRCAQAIEVRVDPGVPGDLQALGWTRPSVKL